MLITVAITATPGGTGCGHLILNCSNQSGGTYKLITSQQELTDDSNESIADALKGCLRNEIRKLRAAGKTWPQVKTAIEAMEFNL